MAWKTSHVDYSFFYQYCTFGLFCLPRTLFILVNHVLYFDGLIKVIIMSIMGARFLFIV